MSEQFYADAALYERLFPAGAPSVDFYRAEADRQGGSVLELGSGTGAKLVTIAADGHPCTGLELSPAMLAEARRKAEAAGVEVDWAQGDMRTFDLGRVFDLVTIPANSLLHLLRAADLVSCLRAARRHLAPGGRLVLDVFNPSVSLLARADGTRRRREDLPGHVEVEETYDAATQVTTATWYVSPGPGDRDAVALPLEIRSIFPQELPLLLALAGLRPVERFGDWSRAPFTSTSPLQIYVCDAVPDAGTS